MKGNGHDASMEEMYETEKEYRKMLEETVEDLKKVIWSAHDVLENDLYVSRAVNAKMILKDALDEHGEPDGE